MSQWALYGISGIAITAVGLNGLFTCEHLVRKVIAANLLGSGVFLVLVALARRAPGAPDPVPHALVLTGIVVSVSATGLLLSLVRRLESQPDEAVAGQAREGPPDGP